MFTQIRIGDPLHDAEQQIARRAGLISFAAAQAPAGAAFYGGGGLAVARPIAQALVELHHDVGIEVALDGYHFFG